MDEAVIKYYRKLLTVNFEYSGSLEKPSIFIKTGGRNLPICGGIGDHLEIYIKVENGIVSEIKYLCICNPVANVAIEILCSLAEGKSLHEVLALSTESFCRVLGSAGEDFQKKVNSLLELVSEEINNYIASKS
jgi:NifU-like protein involved in Fe-S cluster formation